MIPDHSFLENTGSDLNPFFFQANIFQSTRDFFVLFLSVAVMFKELTWFQRLGDKGWGEVAQPIVT